MTQCQNKCIAMIMTQYQNKKRGEHEYGEKYWITVSIISYAGGCGRRLYLVNEAGRVQDRNRTDRVNGEYRYKYENGTIYYVNDRRERIGQVTCSYQKKGRRMVLAGITDKESYRKERLVVKWLTEKPHL